MAHQITKTWDWSSSSVGWSYYSTQNNNPSYMYPAFGTNTTLAALYSGVYFIWDGIGDTSSNQEQGYWEFTDTWEHLFGIPTGSSIFQIKIQQLDTNIQLSTSGSAEFGYGQTDPVQAGIQLVLGSDPSGSSIDLWDGRSNTVNENESTWTRIGEDFVEFDSVASSSSFFIRLFHYVESASGMPSPTRNGSAIGYWKGLSITADYLLPGEFNVAAHTTGSYLEGNPLGEHTYCWTWDTPADLEGWVGSGSFVWGTRDGYLAASVSTNRPSTILQGVVSREIDWTMFPIQEGTYITAVKIKGLVHQFFNFSGNFTSTYSSASIIGATYTALSASGAVLGYFYLPCSRGVSSPDGDWVTIDCDWVALSSLASLYSTKGTLDIRVQAVTKSGSIPSALLEIRLDSLCVSIDIEPEPGTAPYTVDAVIKGTTTKRNYTDAYLKYTFTSAHTLDAFIESSETARHSTDSDLKGERTTESTTDSTLVYQYTVDHTTDSALWGEIPCPHTTDSCLAGVVEKQHTTNASLRGEISVGISTDSELWATLARYSTVSSYLIETTTTVPVPTVPGILSYVEAKAVIEKYLYDEIPIHVIPPIGLILKDWTENLDDVYESIGDWEDYLEIEGDTDLETSLLNHSIVRANLTEPVSPPRDTLLTSVTCNQGCQISCEAFCEKGCEEDCQGLGSCQNSCEWRCEIHCQTVCEFVCQEACQGSCEDDCQSFCQSTCEGDCQAGCENDCEGDCEYGCTGSCEGECEDFCTTQCQNYCEMDCQSAVQDTCQSDCEACCEDSCECGCEEGCEIGCEDSCVIGGCEVDCEAGNCQLDCLTGCQAKCMLYCESICETGDCEYGCTTVCQKGSCETKCQDSCQISGCEQNGCQSCETGCQVNCTTGCQSNCQGGCQTVCQDPCQGGCQTGCQGNCQGGCTGGCQSMCMALCQEGCVVGGCQTTCAGNTCQTACQKGSCQECCVCQCEQSCTSGCTLPCTSGCQTECQAVCEGQGGCEAACQAGCVSSEVNGCEFCCQLCCEDDKEGGIIVIIGGGGEQTPPVIECAGGPDTCEFGYQGGGTCTTAKQVCGLAEWGAI